MVDAITPESVTVRRSEGVCTDVADAIAAGDTLATSDTEGACTVVVDAMTAGDTLATMDAAGVDTDVVDAITLAIVTRNWIDGP